MPVRTKKDRTNFGRTRKPITKALLTKLKNNNVIKDYFYDENFILINAECIATMKELVKEGVVVDHILTDIPYGTVQGLSIEGWKNKNSIPQWDCLIDNMDLFEECFDISKANSNLLLFCQEPLTTQLINSSVDFQKYALSNKMIWVKNNHANGFNAKTTPLNYYEEILLFRKALDENNSVELRSYFKKLSEYIPDDRKTIMSKLGQGLDHCFRYTHRTFYVPTEKNYNALIETYHIDKMDGFIPYEQLKKQWKDENDTVFNIPAGEKIVKNVFEFKKDTNNIHPTQKPILLLEYLLSLFTNEGDHVLDFTCGSASTGIACIHKKRKFIGIELDESFYKASIEWYKEESTKLF